MHDEYDDDLPPHREFTLSTPLLILLFLGLAILCGVFFGLGYMAHTSRHGASLATQPEGPTAASHANFSTFKPPAGSMTGTSTAMKAPPPPTAAATPRVTAAEARHVPVTPAPVNPAPSPTGAFVVQLAAISAAHAEDADMLVSALRAKGYTAAAHKDADGLLHVQVGPFTNRKDADAMRLRLEGDGYKPFIK